MRWPWLCLLVVAAGCHVGPPEVPADVEPLVAAVAAAEAPGDLVPCQAEAALPPGPLDLHALWDVALLNNPSLREAAADVEAARGRLIQAGKYPNPRAVYTQSTIGNSVA